MSEDKSLSKLLGFEDSNTDSVDSNVVVGNDNSVNNNVSNVQDDSDDLLSILQDSVKAETISNSEVDSILSTSEDEETDRKLQELRSLASSLNGVGKGNSGSGDIEVDLENWFNGKDTLPSDELNRYVSASSVKMQYGITKTTLGNITMMGKLKKFLEESFDIIFDPNNVINMDPDDLSERSKVAFTMYEKLAALNQRTIYNMTEQRNKYNENSDQVDRLSVLLSSIPSDKLSEVLQEISLGGKSES